MRSALHDNSQFFRAANTLEKHRIWLDFVNLGDYNANRITIGYATGATQQYDRLFDATADYQGTQSFFSLIGEDVFSMQGRALPFENTDTVPLGFAVPSAGTYKIAIHAVDGLFANNGQNIYLQDNETETVHNLSVSPYTFAATPGGSKTRFVVRYTNGALSNSNPSLMANSVLVFKDKNSLKAQSVSEPIESISVFDILGRSVFSQKNINSDSFEITNVVSVQQALIIKITLNNGTIINKKVVY
jgi:hypothetical protein